ncbi:Iron(III) dicitrate transport protein FecA [Raoultella terrigena]|uniref:Iron(III) dicitrate transport protein FecA n=1 Tax=Raoultella terrigena TaxID=577 RepID=A0A3P8M1I6_RAOTE|nr:Iron(III) dicitrate transport protein FecA [Raoultella terrigena]
MTPLRVLRKPMPLVMAIRLSLLPLIALAAAPAFAAAQFDIAAGRFSYRAQSVRRPQRHHPRSRCQPDPGKHSDGLHGSYDVEDGCRRCSTAAACGSRRWAITPGRWSPPPLTTRRR